MSRLLYRIGRYAAVHRWRVLLAWVLAFVVIGVVGSSLGGSPVDSFDIPGTESQRAFDLLEERFPAQSGSTARVVFHRPDGLTDPAAAEAIAASLERIRAADHVTEVVDPLSAAGADHLSADETIAYAEVRYDVRAQDAGTEAVDALEHAVVPARDAGIQVELGGDVVESNLEEGEPSSELIGIGVAILVLLFAFGSVIAMGLPIVTALFGLGIGLSLITLLTGLLDLNSAGPILATMIGLGVGIDYALFIVTRHRQFLNDGMTVPEAAARANATAGSAVVFAGTTVVIAILGLQIAGLPMVTSMGIASAIAVAVMVLVAIVLLPALLGIVGRKIDSLRVPGMKVRTEDRADTLGARWARVVARRPGLAATAGAVVLIVLALPLLSLRLGSTDAGTEPTSSTLRRAYDLLGDGFGPGFNGPLTVVVDTRDADSDLVPRVADAIAADDGIARVQPAVTNASGDTTVITAFPTTKPQAAATTTLVHRLRDDVIPAVVAEDGGEALVTGSTAAFIDLSDKITARLPWFIAVVVGLSFVLLMTVFRSVLIALKAALMNLLAIGAAYGAVVAIFQWQWGGSLFGVHESLPIISFMPMMMFAILFGLSMDYEVFILSRVREEWLKSGDTRQSVVNGISTTARVITSAALIMISVFGAFMLGGNPLIKMFGFGMAFAVLIDATIVRMVLVPATMELLGDKNWWLPGWLDRILPRITVEGEEGLPEPEYVVPRPDPAEPALDLEPVAAGATS